MKKKNLIFAIIIVVIVLVLVVVLMLNTKTNEKTTDQNRNQTEQGLETGNLSTEPTGNEGETATQSFEEATIPTSLSVAPGSSEAPKQERIEANKIPTNATKLKVSDKGYEPKEFTIKAGQPTTLAVTAIDDNIHVLAFSMPELVGLTAMISGRETKLISFTAPGVGSYSFFDDTPQFNKNTGMMIAK